MQYVIIFLIIGVLIFVLTGNPGLLFYAGYGVLLIASFVLTVFFIYALFLVLISEPKEAVFTRVGEPAPESSHKVAFYRIGETEYPCLFPEEGIFRKRLYKTDRTCRVRLLEKRGRVLDRYAVTTTIVGLIAGFGMEILTVVMLLS